MRVRVWSGQPYRSVRKNVRVGTIHNGKEVTEADDIDKQINELKQKARKGGPMTPEEQEHFCLYWESMTGGDYAGPKERSKEALEAAYQRIKGMDKEDKKKSKPAKKDVDKPEAPVVPSS